MALSRKGSRLITVNQVVYRWKLTRQTVHREMLFWPEDLIILRAEGPRQKLVVHFGYPVWHRVGGVDLFPTPGLVRKAVEDALALGFQPGGRGLPPFVMDGGPFLPSAYDTTYG